ncbi:MAG: DUF928 domain-containing protein [Cyanobacteria bacterium P01_E01_bin.42]
MRQTIFKNTVLYLGIAFYSLSTFAIMPALAGLKSEERGEFPGERVGGGTRSSSVCARRSRQLVGLSPKNNLGISSREQPSIYVAVPELDRAYPAEFLLIDKEGNEIYKQNLEIGRIQRFVGVRLPENILNIGQDYEWYFDVFCFEDNIGEAIGVNGTLRQVSQKESDERQANLAETLALVQSYQAAGLWNDAIATAFELRQNYPESELAFAQWRQVLLALDFSAYDGLFEMLLAIPVSQLQVSE